MSKPAEVPDSERSSFGEAITAAILAFVFIMAFIHQNTAVVPRSITDTNPGLIGTRQISLDNRQPDGCVRVTRTSLGNSGQVTSLDSNDTDVRTVQTANSQDKVTPMIFAGIEYLCTIPW